MGLSGLRTLRYKIHESYLYCKRQDPFQVKEKDVLELFQLDSHFPFRVSPAPSRMKREWYVCNVCTFSNFGLMNSYTKNTFCVVFGSEEKKSSLLFFQECRKRRLKDQQHLRLR
jgi:hypothetical protein